MKTVDRPVSGGMIGSSADAMTSGSVQRFNEESALGQWAAVLGYHCWATVGCYSPFDKGVRDGLDESVCDRNGFKSSGKSINYDKNAGYAV